MNKMPDCQNSPDGYCKFTVLRRSYQLGDIVALCKYCKREIERKLIERLLNKIVRLSNEQLDVAAMLDNDDIHEILNQKATEVYATHRKGG